VPEFRRGSDFRFLFLLNFLEVKKREIGCFYPVVQVTEAVWVSVLPSVVCALISML
jgi:hypothetical protein